MRESPPCYIILRLRSSSSFSGYRWTWLSLSLAFNGSNKANFWIDLSCFCSLSDRLSYLRSSTIGSISPSPLSDSSLVVKRSKMFFSTREALCEGSLISWIFWSCASVIRLSGSSWLVASYSAIDCYRRLFDDLDSRRAWRSIVAAASSSD